MVVFQEEIWFKKRWEIFSISFNWNNSLFKETFHFLQYLFFINNKHEIINSLLQWFRIVISSSSWLVFISSYKISIALENLFSFQFVYCYKPINHQENMIAYDFFLILSLSLSIFNRRENINRVIILWILYWRVTVKMLPHFFKIWISMLYIVLTAYILKA